MFRLHRKTIRPGKNVIPTKRIQNLLQTQFIVFAVIDIHTNIQHLDKYIHSPYSILLALSFIGIITLKMKFTKMIKTAYLQ